jgi:superfamily I DNA and/or RNA helicase
VILFSTVYASNENTRTYFFDHSVNMLNVAVSRAKDSFVLMGDLYMLDEDLKSPSGLLIKHLHQFGQEL